MRTLSFLGCTICLLLTGCGIRIGEDAQPYKSQNHDGLNKAEHPDSSFQQPGSLEQKLQQSGIKLLEHKSTGTTKNQVERDERVQMTMQVFDLKLQPKTSGTFYAYTYRMPEALWRATEGMSTNTTRRLVLPQQDGLCPTAREHDDRCDHRHAANNTGCRDNYPHERYEKSCELDLYGDTNKAELTNLDFDTAYIVDITVHRTCKPIWLTTCGLGGIFSSGCDSYELWCN